jgi:hypothetical protein
MVLSAGSARADWGTLRYGGFQPWWDCFAHRKCKTCEEKRLERFWHDYYDAMRRYYASLGHIDWVAYYKNHGYQLNAGCGMGNGNYGCMPGCGGGCQQINYAPVVVNPCLQWAVPAGGCAPTGCGPAGVMGCSGPGGY